MSRIHTTIDNDMLDAICQREYGQTSGAVEIVYKANVGLADRGLVFPSGIEIFLPDIPKPSDNTRYQQRLWD